MRDVKGKVAFITGGSSGVGLGIARAFAEAGMKICIGYRTQRHADTALEILRSVTDAVHAINVDVTDRGGMEGAAKETARVFGKIHALVNNAGVATLGPLSSASYKDWDWVMRVNVDGVFNGVHCFLPYLRSHGEGGQIISTSSIAGLAAGTGTGSYSLSKFAVVGMMESLRMGFDDTDIGVSVFCPGVVRSDMPNADRNRPENLTNPKTPLSDEEKARQVLFVKSHQNGIDPLVAGRLVLAGMRTNSLYILSHPEHGEVIRARADAMLAAAAVSGSVDETQLKLTREWLSKSVYAKERDRALCGLGAKAVR
ncbi:SDR family oxidoreductase [Peristeroidobacter agariperforans]|uniref:SDR family oxidoreductase n=1 Tax=Peristeroidobacter agariperforans TaxID=268404 RepID=UPI00101DFBF3|nr:SDR family NAD(P)-dependent oxidoreductase [Peristeroidobacter agariperforans]